MPFVRSLCDSGSIVRYKVFTTEGKHIGLTLACGIDYENTASFFLSLEQFFNQNKQPGDNIEDLIPDFWMKRQKIILDALNKI